MGGVEPPQQCIISRLGIASPTGVEQTCKQTGLARLGVALVCAPTRPEVHRYGASWSATATANSNTAPASTIAMANLVSLPGRSLHQYSTLGPGATSSVTAGSVTCISFWFFRSHQGMTSARQGELAWVLADVGHRVDTLAAEVTTFDLILHDRGLRYRPRGRLPSQAAAVERPCLAHPARSA